MGIPGGRKNTLSDYSNAMLIDFVPGYILEDPDTHQPVRSKRSTVIGDAKAKEFVKKNLARNGEWNNNEIVDGYGKDNDLTFTSNLYGSGQEDDGYYTMWYQVVLEEDVKHLFMPGWFEPMTARVQSTAKLTHYTKGDNLLNMTETIAKRETYENWDFIKLAKGNKDNGPADNRSVLSTGNKYREGDHHRFEVLRLDGYGGKNNPDKGNPYTSRGKVDQRGYDDLFVD